MVKSVKTNLHQQPSILNPRLPSHRPLKQNCQSKLITYKKTNQDLTYPINDTQKNLRIQTVKEQSKDQKSTIHSSWISGIRIKLNPT